MPRSKDKGPSRLTVVVVVLEGSRSDRGVECGTFLFLQFPERETWTNRWSAASPVKIRTQFGNLRCYSGFHQRSAITKKPLVWASLGLGGISVSRPDLCLFYCNFLFFYHTSAKSSFSLPGRSAAGKANYCVSEELTSGFFGGGRGGAWEKE